jgi:hypothetical protein
MDPQPLIDALQDLASAQYTLMQLTKWLSALVVVLAVGTLGGFIWLGVELRAIRHMLGHIQTSAEHIADMTRDILRRV